VTESSSNGQSVTSTLVDRFHKPEPKDATLPL